MSQKITWQSVRVRSLASLLIAIGLLAGALARGEGPAPDVQKQSAKEAKTLKEFIDQAVDWYELFPDAESQEPAKAVRALRWANNARGSEDGITVLYIHDGLPLATSCVYPWQRNLEHCFGSLSRDKIIARRDGSVVWNPQAPSTKFADIPGAPVPDATRAGRLRQMKTLSERFEATMLGWKPDKTDREELRRLTKPLYRYEPKSGKIVDGMVVAFVMGTDPEVLLQIEALKSGDKVTWQYAFTRRTSGALEGRLDKAAVWTAELFPQQYDPKLPYFSKSTPLPSDIVAELSKG